MRKSIYEKIEEIRLRYLSRFDADDSDEEGEQPKKRKKYSALSTRLPFGLCKSEGIDTEGMTPREAWEAWEKKTGKSAASARAEKMRGVKAEETEPKKPEPKTIPRGRIANMRSKLLKLRHENIVHGIEVDSIKKSLDFFKQRKQEEEEMLEGVLSDLNEKYKDVGYDRIVQIEDNKRKRYDSLRDKLNDKKYGHYGYEGYEWEAFTDDERRKIVKDYFKLQEDVRKAEHDFHEVEAEVERRDSMRRIERAIKDSDARIEQYEQKLREVDDPNIEAKLKRAEKNYEKTIAQYDRGVLNKFKSVEDCEFASDVTDYLRAKGYFVGERGKFDADIDVNLDDMTTDYAKKIGGQIEKVFTDYPQFTGLIKGVDCHDMTNEPFMDNVYGYSQPSNGGKVSLNYAYFKPGGYIEKSYDKCVNDNFHPPGTTYESIVDHEFTHSMENIINDRLNKGRPVGGQRAADIVMRRVQERLDGSYNKGNEDFYRLQVSEYALKNQGLERDADGKLIRVNTAYGGNTEWLAEAMAEARTSKSPRDIAVAVREEFEKLMREVGL